MKNIIFNRETFALYIEQAPDGIALIDQDGKIIIWNKALEKLTKIRSADIIGKYLWDLHFELMNDFQKHNNTLDDLKAFVLNHIHQRKPLKETIINLKNKKGQELCLSLKGFLIGDKTEKYLGVTIRDFTQRKKLIAELKLQNDQLSFLFNNINAGLLLIDKKGKICRANDHVSNVTGISASELTGKNFGEVIRNLFPKEMHVKFQKIYKRLRKEEEIEPFDIEFRNRIFNVSLKARMKDFGILATITDVTKFRQDEQLKLKYTDELKKAIEHIQAEYLEKEQELKKSQKALTFLLEDVNESRKELSVANEQLKNVIQELESFTYSVSHDLRAPLRAISGFTNILTEEYGHQLDEEGHRLCKIIIENTTYLSQLIEDLLKLSRVGRTELMKENINMKKMVESVIEEISAALDNKKITFNIGKLTHVFGDPVLLRQVWVNLISNAVKFSSKEESPVISINSSEKEDSVEFCVSDNGVGFDMKYAHKLFNVFQRLHNRKDYEGTGIGLAIVQQIIQKHGGRVRAEGEPDKGAKFYFSLPKIPN